MPHLSPLFWACAPFMFFSLLLMLHSSTWWSLSPSFPKSNQLMMINHSHITEVWKWN